MFKRALFILMVVALAGPGLVWLRGGVVYAQDPTIPTRTPTPDPNAPPPPGPTAEATDDNGGNPPPPPPADNTPEPPTATPANAATATAQARATSTPTGGNPPAGATPTGPGPSGITGVVVGGSCDETPYVQAIARLAVQAGPGIDYPPVGTLEQDEMRRITGRAPSSTWWQIELEPGLAGWVLDGEVNESGNTALVPVVAPPPINGETPTPGAPWNPTPLPLLTCVPTPTPSATPTATSTAEGGAAAVVAAEPGTPTPTLTPAAGDLSEEAIAELPGVQLGTGTSARGSDASRAAASATSSVNLILPIAGIGLIAAGIILALMARGRGQPEAPETPTKK